MRASNTGRVSLQLNEICGDSVSNWKNISLVRALHSRLGPMRTLDLQRVSLQGLAIKRDEYFVRTRILYAFVSCTTISVQCVIEEGCVGFSIRCLCVTVPLHMPACLFPRSSLLCWRRLFLLIQCLPLGSAHSHTDRYNGQSCYSWAHVKVRGGGAFHKFYPDKGIGFINWFRILDNVWKEGSTEPGGLLFSDNRNIYYIARIIDQCISYYRWCCNW